MPVLLLLLAVMAACGRGGGGENTKQGASWCTGDGMERSLLVLVLMGFCFRGCD